jgi:hypothetical protein
MGSSPWTAGRNMGHGRNLPEDMGWAQEPGVEIVRIPERDDDE